MSTYYITWLRWKRRSLRLSAVLSFWGLPYDTGLKWTNHKFGLIGEVCQSNILVPSKIPFIWKCVFPNFINIIFSKSVCVCVCVCGGETWPPQSLPLCGPCVITVLFFEIRERDSYRLLWPNEYGDPQILFCKFEFLLNISFKTINR